MKALLDAKYQLDGVIVIDGLNGKFQLGAEEYPNVRTGRELVALGISESALVKLIENDYLIPMTNQPLVESALVMLSAARQN